jgi:hypothetical protein
MIQISQESEKDILLRVRNNDATILCEASLSSFTLPNISDGIRRITFGNPLAYWLVRL